MAMWRGPVSPICCPPPKKGTTTNQIKVAHPERVDCGVKPEPAWLHLLRMKGEPLYPTSPGPWGHTLKIRGRLRDKAKGKEECEDLREGNRAEMGLGTPCEMPTRGWERRISGWE